MGIKKKYKKLSFLVKNILKKPSNIYHRNSKLDLKKNINITFSTCWYELDSKFSIKQYYRWIANLLSCVENFYLVVYTDLKSKKKLEKFTKNNPNIKIIVKNFDSFYLYQYKSKFIKNHTKNYALNTKLEWKVNMLYCEKINFVTETIKKKIFLTPFYGWCDIGYFRYTTCKNWPNLKKIPKLEKNKIYYVLAESSIQEQEALIKYRDKKGLPHPPIDPDRLSIAGGMFVGEKEKCLWWKKYFYQKLNLYFNNNYLVKDDEMIILDCYLNNKENFKLIKGDFKYIKEAWFGFQKYLK